MSLNGRLVGVSLVTIALVDSCVAAWAWCVFDMQTTKEIAIAMALANVIVLICCGFGWLTWRLVRALVTAHPPRLRAARSVMAGLCALDAAMCLWSASLLSARSESIMSVVALVLAFAMLALTVVWLWLVLQSTRMDLSEGS